MLGVYELPNGTKHEGVFKKKTSKKNGVIKTTFPNGEIEYRYWANNFKVSEISHN